MSFFGSFAMRLVTAGMKMARSQAQNGTSLFQHSSLLNCIRREDATQVRTRIKFNLYGQPETVKEVPERFFRLYNGLWIRGRAGRKKKMWKKSLRRLHRLRQHVVCNKSQCIRLDKMVNMEYKVPHHYVDDPYQVYHRKSNLPDYRFKPKKIYP